MTDHLDLGPKTRAARRMPRWTLQLSFFMRAVAAAWFVKGVTWWMDIFGFDQAADFESKRAAVKAVTIGFGVMDLVAAVGMWLLSAWGGVMWLLAVTTEIVLTFVAPRVFTVTTTRIATLVALVVIYLFLSSLSAREAEPE
ncbi:DUF6163 family protein [Terrarubrum flagellatum]|uniref:DUF6163 family protein n=1 Tax=Terrirubrum flagellatum TaxID=2895980 RepID=UPI0031450AE6